MSGTGIRIAAHCGGGSFGGTETWTARFMAGLGDRGHEPLILCRDPDMQARFEAFGVPVSIGKLGGVAMLPHAVALSRQLKRFQPQVFLCLTFRKIWLAGLAGRLARVPRVIFRVANQDTYPRDSLYRFSFRHFVDDVLCNADALRGPFLSHAPGFDPRRVITVYDGITPGTPTPGASVREDLGLGDVPVVGSVGRLAGQKRVDRLLDAVALLPGVHCVIAGDGPERGAVEARIEVLGLSDRVHLLGHRSDVADVLAALDLFLLTSDFEGMSNAMLEAMAMGVPVVSTPVSGAVEALAPESEAPAGRVVEASAEAIAEATSALLGDPETRDRVAEGARQRYQDAFTFEAMLDVWERVIQGEPVASFHQGASPLAG